MDGPSVKVRKSYRDMEIPAWMDFSEEEEISSSEEWDSEEEYDEEEGNSEEEGYSDEEDEDEGDSEDEMKRKMCIAWLLARKEFSKKIEDNRDETFPVTIQGDDNGEQVERKEEIRRRAWWPPSAEEQSRARWKATEMDRLTDISLVVFRKKVFEFEKSCVTKLGLKKEAQENGVQPDMELERSNKSYLEFRNMWIAIHSCWSGGGFEDITDICSMSYTDESVPQYVCNYGPPDTLQIFSIKVGGIHDGGLLCWPLHVFGLVAVRDSVDQYRNVIFDRPRYDCQIVTKEDPYLVLTGPTRAVVMNDESIPVTIEAELKVKSTDDGSEDKHLIFAAVVLPSQFGSSGSIDLTDGSSNLKIGLGRMVACVEASIFTRVIDGTWPTDSSVQFAARTSSMNHREIVLADFGGDNMPTTDDGSVDLSRFVVSVELFGELTVSCKAWRGNETMQDEVVFKAEKKGRSYGTLKVGSCILEVLVAWSPIRPVCEELISISEMVLC